MLLEDAEKKLEATKKELEEAKKRADKGKNTPTKLEKVLGALQKPKPRMPSSCLRANTCRPLPLPLLQPPTSPQSTSVQKVLPLPLLPHCETGFSHWPQGVEILQGPYNGKSKAREQKQLGISAATQHLLRPHALPRAGRHH